MRGGKGLPSVTPTGWNDPGVGPDGVGRGRPTSPPVPVHLIYGGSFVPATFTTHTAPRHSNNSAMPKSLASRFGTLAGPIRSKPLPKRHAVLQEMGYTLGHNIGTGGYAKVKYVIHEESGTAYAAKIVSKHKAPPGYMTKFLPREIASLKKLEHPNIVKMYDMREEAENVYMILELAPNGDMLEYINSHGPLTEAETRVYFGQLVSAVQHCHANGVVHRDLKCENILLGKGYAVKVADFGFAREVQSTLQLLNTHCGSYAYAAPEILLNKPYRGPEVDVWSLGVIFYAMLVGQLPFDDCDINTLLKQIHRGVEIPRALSKDCRNLTQTRESRVKLTDVEAVLVSEDGADTPREVAPVSVSLRSPKHRTPRRRGANTRHNPPSSTKTRSNVTK